jgi:uroporphyrinogen-III synthase
MTAMAEAVAGAAKPSTRGTLASCRIVVTRPAAQAVTLAQAIREAGGEPVLFPTIEIRDAENPAVLDGALSKLTDYDWAIFVSPNAVEKTFARNPSWPASIRAAAVGPGTRAALAAHGVLDALVPAERFDSESLLALPELAAVRGARCVIFRGNGGRELIATELAKRGAAVDLVECYRRALPESADADALLARWTQGGVDAVTLTSSEGVHNFATLLGASAKPCFARTPAFAPHERIAEAARRIGFADVVATGAADTGLLDALGARFAGRSRE